MSQAEATSSTIRISRLGAKMMPDSAEKISAAEPVVRQHVDVDCLLASL